MFEKMTPRERKLAYGVLALLPVAILFIGVFSFIKKYNANEITDVAIQRQIDEQDLLMAEAKKANRRRVYYNQISLPAKLENASNEYHSWMKGLVRDELKMTLKSLNPRDAGDLKFNRKVIGKRKAYSLNAECTVEQLRDFLVKFYSVDMMHRINTMKIVAKNETTSNNKKIRTGKLSFLASIEVLSLTTATTKKDFIDRFKAEGLDETDLAKANQKAGDEFVVRDMFGPPNNTPTIKVSTSSSYLTGKDVRAGVTVKDADEEDELIFELIESDVEGAKIEPSKPGSRSGKFLLSGQEPGRYKFKARVIDNGRPAKETIESFTVVFKDPPKPKAKPEPPKPDPPYVEARQTRITAILLDKEGDWRVWIKVQTSGDRHQPTVGESFELDGAKWTVKKITPEEATFQVENKLLTFAPLDMFDSPKKESVIPDPPGAEEAKAMQDGAKSEPESKDEPESDLAPRPRVG